MPPLFIESSGFIGIAEFPDFIGIVWAKDPPAAKRVVVAMLHTSSLAVLFIGVLRKQYHSIAVCVFH